MVRKCQRNLCILSSLAPVTFYTSVKYLQMIHLPPLNFKVVRLDSWNNTWGNFQSWVQAVPSAVLFGDHVKLSWFALWILYL